MNLPRTYTAARNLSDPKWNVRGLLNCMEEGELELSRYFHINIPRFCQTAVETPRKTHFGTLGELDEMDIKCVNKFVVSSKYIFDL